MPKLSMTSLSARIRARLPQCGADQSRMPWIERDSRILILRLMPMSWNRQRRGAPKCAAIRLIQSSFYIISKKWQTDSRVILLCIYIEHFLHTYKANHTVQNNDKKRRFTPDSTKTNYKLTSHYSIIVHNKCSYQIYFTSFNFRSREVRYDESTVCLNRFWQILWQFVNVTDQSW